MNLARIIIYSFEYSHYLRSSLDSRGALVVIRAMRRIADSGEYHYQLPC